MASITPVVPSAGGSGRLPDSGHDAVESLPQFEWYLGPMYRRYSEIMAERERANTAQVVKKKVTPTVPDEPAYIKHITARTPDILDYAFIAQVVQQGFSRFPVVEPSSGQVVGLLHCKDLLSLRDPDSGCWKRADPWV
eukprot:g16228.t1